MKLSATLFLVFASLNVMSQDLLDRINNRIVDSLIESLTDSTGISDSSFVHHDTTNVKLDLYINAVCRVVLTDGSIVEGFIEFANDSAPNAFYFENGKSSSWKVKQMFYIDFYFGGFARRANENPKIFRDYKDEPDDTVSFADVTNVYYLERSGYSRLGNPERVEIVEEDGEMHMQINTQSRCEYRYRMRDNLDIYQELAPNTFTRRLSGIKIVTVRISEIVSFELLTRPRKKWLNIISQNRIDADIAHKASGGTGVAHKTNWYHIIQRDPALVEHIQNCIDLNSESMGKFVLH
jgi:hypothetical protein